MLDKRIRFYLDTTYDDDGRTIARVMERPRPFAEAVCVDTCFYEWQACKRIDELKREAFHRGESVIFSSGYHQVSENPWRLEKN